MKRILSMILTLCMLLSFLPTFQIVGAAEPYTYSFHPGTNNVGLHKFAEYGEGNPMWRYIGCYALERATTAHELEVPSTYTKTNYKGLRIYNEADAMWWVAIELNIPAIGEYKPTLGYGPAKTGDKVNVYVLPKGATLTEEAISFDSFPGAVKLNNSAFTATVGTSSAPTAVTKAPLDNTFTTTEENEKRIVVFAAVDAGPAGNGNTYIAGIDLELQTITYTVEYNAGAGSVYPTSETVAENSSVTLPTPTREGYNFLGWSDGETTYNAGDTYTVSKSVTFTAQWEEIVGYKFTVTYNANSGESTPDAVETEAGAITLAAAITRDGYNFLGWSDGETTYAAGDSYTVSKSVTFTAQWEEIVGYKFTVTYNANGGESTPDAVQTEAGDITLAEAITREGYDFIGWSDGEMTYAAGDTYTVSKSVTFTAQWQTVWTPPTITADYAGTEATRTFVFAYTKSTWANPVVSLKSAITGDVSGPRDLRGITAEFTDGWYAYAWTGEYKKQHDSGYWQDRSFYQPSDMSFHLNAQGSGAFSALAFPFETTGRYDMEIIYGESTGISDVYFIPMSDLEHNDGKAYYYITLDDVARGEVLTDEEKALYPPLPQERIDEIKTLTSTNQYKIGELDSTAYDGTTKVMSLEVTAPGDHLLVFKRRTAGMGHHIVKIKFNGSYVAQQIKKNQLNPQNGLMSAGDETTLSLADKFGNPIDTFNLISISSSDNDIATVDDSLKVTAVGDKLGRATISAIVSVNGKEQEAVGYVRVVNTANSNARLSHALDTRYNNASGQRWENPSYVTGLYEYTSASRGLNDICGFAEGHGITTDYTDGWSWYGYDQAISKGEMTFHMSNGNFFRSQPGPGQWYALKTTFKTAGRYRVMLGYLAFTGNGDANVYLIPVPKEGETVESYITDAYKVGYFNCEDTKYSAWNDAGAARTSYLGDAYVEEPGEYLIVVQGISGKLLVVNDILFSGASPITGVSVPSKTLGVGETLELGSDMLSWEMMLDDYIQNCELSYENLTPEVLSLSGNVVTAIANGIGKVKLTASWKGYEDDFELIIGVGSVKNRRTYYTDEKVENARRNIQRYDWARSEMRSVVEKADEYVNDVDRLWNMVTTQELPRAQRMIARFNDTGNTDCIYCGVELRTEYGDRPWKIDQVNKPWKLECPECGKFFPSNDFESLYELGIDENANWNYDLAMQRHHEMFVCANGENCTCTAPKVEHPTSVSDTKNLATWLTKAWRTEEWQNYYGYGKGYLKNTEFSGTDAYGNAIDDTWGVDDGWGYDYVWDNPTPGGADQNRIEPFVAWYNYYGVWGAYASNKGSLLDVLQVLSDAYVYTGDARYGRVGAILVDRIADVYPDFDCTLKLGSRLPVADNSYKYSNGALTGVPRGVILGKLHDVIFVTQAIKAYDAFWPALEDPEVQAYLSEKAEKYNFDNKKTTAQDIARNIDNNLLRIVHQRRVENAYQGNFPQDRIMHILAGVILDSSPEVADWIEFEFRPGGSVGKYEYTGGDISGYLVTQVSRDGHGNEVAPGYNAAWATNLLELGNILDGYDKIPEDKRLEYDIFANPKFIRMLTAQIEILCATTGAPNIGDHDSLARPLYGLSDTDTLLTAYQYTTDEEMKKNIARVLYRVNGKNLDSIHGGIFMAEPEGLIGEISDMVNETTSAIILPSQNFTGYGLAILRAGDWFMPDTSRNVNTQRNFFISYGGMTGHGHLDKLNLVFYAYGLEVGPDPGEAEVKDTVNPHRYEFDRVTQSHNTVTVNNLSQRTVEIGYPNHFDDAGRVQLMDIENADVYDWLGVDEYRRTLVMVDANDDISYGVDFFHVSGGEDHLYSFHALGKEADMLVPDAEGNDIDMQITSQTDGNGKYIGSYQGEDKPWGKSTVNSIDINNAYGGKHYVYDIDRDLGGKTDGLGTDSWFGEVDRANDPANTGVFSVDWKIDDFRHSLNPAQRDLRVRLTMLNSFKLDEITTTSGIPAQVEHATDKMRYLFARHTGVNDGKAQNEKLDTLFTSVVEPYNKDRYVKSIEKVTVTRADGAEFKMDEAKAVKVTLTNGRVDYIVYAKDTTVPYKVHYKTSAGEDKTFDFCGFVGVVSMMNDKVTYSYVNDGTTVGDMDGLTSAFTGKVTGFLKKTTMNNYIDVSFTPGQTVDEDAIKGLAGRYIYVDNVHSRSLQNGSYRIESAEAISGGARLYLGNTALAISASTDPSEEDEYNIEVGQDFRIPLSYVEDGAPKFDPMNAVTTTAGNSTTATVKANSTEGVRYESVTLPRGASFDGTTGTVTWRPDESQIGDNLVQIDAIDDSGRVSRINFAITVYGKTTGDDGGTPGGGGGGGGGGAPLPDDDTDNDTPTDDTPDTGDDAGDESGENTGDTSTGTEDGSLRFIDLTNHAWAADAINSLADEGVIKGTSDNTYSPANNIIRADYAILLVRAFEQTSDSTENFDDVNAADYFAHELAIARNTGIVQGIGNNMFAPRKNIMRQDMMLMTYRALKALGIELEIGDVEAPDLDKVDEYALDAVRALISNGLVNGKNGYIDPKAYTTRAEVAVLLKRILDYVK